jgi:hypothetical protein
MIESQDRAALAGAIAAVGLGWACFYLAVTQSWLVR